MRKKTIQILTIFLLMTIVSFSQNIVNSASYYTNNMEYNTGEIFVVYTFTNGSTATSKEISDIKNTNDVVNINTAIKLFPNPVKTTLEYETPKDFEFISVEVFDHNQKLLQSYNIDVKAIPFESYPSGIYYIKFNKKEAYIFKIIKQ